MACALSVSCIGTGMIGAVAEGNEVPVIATSDDFDSLNILYMTEHSDSADWVFTMIYDRLISVDNSGRFQPELATSCYIVDGPSYISSTSGAAAASCNLMSANSSGEYYDDFTDYLDPDWDGNAPGWKSPAADVDEAPLFLDGGGTLVLELTLREDAMFWDGTPVTTEAVVDLITFAKNQLVDTLIHRQWESVSSVTALDDLTFQMTFSFSDKNYGFMDFMYGLASPIGSIVRVDGNEGEIAVGSGAYLVDSVIEEESVELVRNDNWWNTPAANERVAFAYYPDLNSAGNALMDEEVQFSEVSLNTYAQIADDSSGYYAEYITANPLILLPNPALESNLMAAVDLFIDAREWLDMDLLYGLGSNSFWLFLDSYDYETGMDILDEYLNQGYENKLYLLVCEDNLSLAQYIQAQLELFSVYVEINSVPKNTFETFYQRGSYDLVLMDVDLHNINSILNPFMGKYLNDDLNYALDMAKISANLSAYARSYCHVQRTAYINHLVNFFGWQNRFFAYPDSVSFTLPDGKFPTGDIGRFDFRYFTVNG